MDVMSLGYEQLDRLLGGGIAKGKSTILVGEPGCGKSDLALGFLVDSIHEPIPSAYICIDKKPEQVMEKALTIHPSVDERIQNDSLKFVEISIQDWHSDQDINDLLLTIQLQVDALFQNFIPERIVIDSLIPQVISHLPNTKQY